MGPGANKSWKVGRDDSCMTKINEEQVSVKPSNHILKNPGIPFHILQNGLLLQEWQWLITRPEPHDGCQSKEGGKARLPVVGMKTILGCVHVDSLEGGDLESLSDSLITF